MHEVAKNGCWIWTGPTCSGGRYGRIPGTKPLKMAHRAAYEAAKGAIPEGKLVCHTCDNGLCINPSHLFLGSHSENMKDAAKKKRLPHLLKQARENNSNAKYTQEQIEEIRRYYETHRPSFSGLAKAFGLSSKGYAHAIVTKRIWR